MVYNNVAISQFLFFNSLLRKGKRWRRGEGCTKNWQIPKYCDEKSTKYRYLIHDRLLALICCCVSWCLLYWPVLDRRAQMNGTAKPWRILFYWIRTAKRMKNCIPQGYRDHSTIVPFLKFKLLKCRVKESAILTVIK